VIGIELPPIHFCSARQQANPSSPGGRSTAPSSRHDRGLSYAWGSAAGAISVGIRSIPGYFPVTRLGSRFRSRKIPGCWTGNRPVSIWT